MIHCPNQVAVPFEVGQVVHFPTDVCASCPLRDRCTTSKTGRCVSIHPDESLLQELRQRQVTAPGRAKLRERVAVEHTLAHIGQWLFSIALVTLALAKTCLTCAGWQLSITFKGIARMPEPAADEVA